MDRRILHRILRDSLASRAGREIPLPLFESRLVEGDEGIVRALLAIGAEGRGAERLAAFEALNEIRSEAGLNRTAGEIPTLLGRLLAEPTPWGETSRGAWIENLYRRIVSGPLKARLRSALLDLRREKRKDPVLAELVGKLLIVDEVEPDGRVVFLPT